MPAAEQLTRSWRKRTLRMLGKLWLRSGQFLLGGHPVNAEWLHLSYFKISPWLHLVLVQQSWCFGWLSYGENRVGNLEEPTGFHFPNEWHGRVSGYDYFLHLLYDICPSVPGKEGCTVKSLQITYLWAVLLKCSSTEETQGSSYHYHGDSEWRYWHPSSSRPKIFCLNQCCPCWTYILRGPIHWNWIISNISIKCLFCSYLKNPACLNLLTTCT